MKVTRFVAVCAAVLLAVSAAGCAAVDTVDVNSEDIDYSRVLYPEGDLYTDSDDEELDEEFYDEEQTEHEEERSSDEKKEASSKKEEKKKETEKKKSESSKAASSALISSRAASSRPVSSRAPEQPKASSQAASSKRSKQTVYRISDLRSKSSDTDIASDSDINSDTDTEIRELPPSAFGRFTEEDLSYNAEKDFLDFGDDESFVLYAMGEPAEKSQSDDGQLLTYVYKDCTITFKYFEDKSKFLLVDIEVPFDSYYETEKIVSTGSTFLTVTSAYGEPTQIIPYSQDAPQEPEQNDISSNESESSEQDTSTESEQSEPEDTSAETTDSESTSDEEITESQSDSENEQEPQHQQEIEPQIEITMSGCTYVYSLENKSLIFYIENNRVVKIKYTWNV